ncbi:MAG TPA: ATP-binding protein [Steroidobacteraceae bacterium]|jgi:nitrogen fixation/metabolism regulation signal transduction histidine kinase
MASTAAPMRRRLWLFRSLAGRVGIALVLVAVAAAGGSAAGAWWLAVLTPASAAICAAAGIAVGTVAAIYLSRRMTSTWTDVLGAVRDGIESMRDRDFSISIGHVSDDDLGKLVAAYNSIGELLRRERMDLYQRELLLDTVIQTTPLVTVLTNSSGQIVFSNLAARQLFHEGRKLEGLNLATLLDSSPAPLREALGGDGDRLFTMEVDGESEVFHLSQRQFHLNSQPHRLVMLKQLTRELAAQEVVIWKKVIRVIAHELNNSLAPISSLAHSGQLLAEQAGQGAPPGDAPRDEAATASLLAAPLRRVFATIADRAAHLTSFIEGYASFAKLPLPRVAPVIWSHFLGRLQDTVPFQTDGPVPDTRVSFDASQMEQVMINLLKNAAESGSAAEGITVSTREQPGSFIVEVADRGSGLSETVLRDALLPFYSTKPAGTGLGLTLCREIVDAHGGRISLANRPDGGAIVTVWLPNT